MHYAAKAFSVHLLYDGCSNSAESYRFYVQTDTQDWCLVMPGGFSSHICTSFQSRIQIKTLLRQEGSTQSFATAKLAFSKKHMDSQAQTLPLCRGRKLRTTPLCLGFRFAPQVPICFHSCRSTYPRPCSLSLKRLFLVTVLAAPAAPAPRGR